MRSIGWFLASLLLVVIVAAIVPRQSPAVQPVLPRFFLVVVAHPSLDEAAEAWRRYRRGQGGVVVRVSALEPDGTPRSAVALRDAIRASIADEPPTLGTTAVLLLGDVDTIPTFFFDQPDPALVDRRDPRYSTDHPYQLRDDRDDLPDLALGRIPVSRTVDALAVLEKIRRYEASSVGPWRSRLTFLAGEGRFGPADRILEGLFRTMVDTMVPPRFDFSMTYANPTSVWCPPPSTMRDVFVDRFAEGSLLVNYAGHGHPTGLDSMRWNDRRIPLMGGPDPSRLDQPRDELPIAFLGCCSVGWFDLPEGDPSFAESLLLAPGGPIAVISGTRKTHPYGNAVLQKNLLRLLVAQRVATVGELDLLSSRQLFHRDSEDLAIDLLAMPIAAAARWPCTLDELRVMHARLYNLLGDPCTVIAYPPIEPASLELRSGTLHGSVDAHADGTVEFIIECPRADSAAGPLIGATRDDPELDRIAAANYPRANQRELARGSGPLRRGRFSIPLPDPLPDGAALIRVRIVSGSGDPQWLGALALAPLKIPPSETSSSTTHSESVNP